MTQVDIDTSSDDSVAPELEVKEYTYDDWMASTGIPIHRGYFIKDLRTVELGWWEAAGVRERLHPVGGTGGGHLRHGAGDPAGADPAAAQVRPRRAGLRAPGPRRDHGMAGRQRRQDQLRMAAPEPVPDPAQLPPRHEQHARRPAGAAAALQLPAAGDVAQHRPVVLLQQPLRGRGPPFQGRRALLRGQAGCATATPPGPGAAAAASSGTATSFPTWAPGTSSTAAAAGGRGVTACS